MENCRIVAGGREGRRENLGAPSMGVRASQIMRDRPPLDPESAVDVGAFSEEAARTKAARKKADAAKAKAAEAARRRRGGGGEEECGSAMLQSTTKHVVNSESLLCGLV